MRDLLSKLDAIVSETELKNPEDLQAKRKALQDLQMDPVASKDPEISQAIIQRKADLEKEAKAKGFSESFQIGDAFGISFSEDHEIATEIVDILEDGIVIELDDTALDMLTNEGLQFLEGELVEDKQKGVDGKACWKGYKRMGTKQKGGKTVDNCVKMEDHGPENPDATVNYGEYDREGDMAKDDLRTIDSAAEELYSILQADDNLPEWVQSKITKAVDYIDTARDYMKAQKYEESVTEGSAHGYNVVRWYRKNRNSSKITAWLKKEAGLPKETKLYFDDADLVLGSDTVVPEALVDDTLKFNDLLTALVQITGGSAKQKVDGVYRSQDVAEDDVDEAKYQGREVPLGKKMAGDVKKSKVYVRKPNGNIVKVNFGDKKMRIKKSNPARRKSFRARHNCANPGPRHKARYWSCRSW